MTQNKLYYGDNLDILREEIGDKSVDLIYLDPPFNSNRSYNVIFANRGGEEAQAQIEAFDDTWTWTNASDVQYRAMLDGEVPSRVADYLEAMRLLLGPNDVLAYLVMMAPRLVELHRVLKDTGSLYLHCDPTTSHYLKVLLDAVFDPINFRNEVIWRRTGAHTTPKRFETTHDVILFYAKGRDTYFSPLKRPYTTKHVESRYTKDDQGRYKFVTGGNILSGPGVTEGDSGQAWRGFDPTAKGRHWAIPGYLAKQMDEDFEELTTTEKLEALYQAGLVEIKEGAAWPHPVKYLSPEDGTFVPDIWAYQPGTEGVLHGTDEGIDADVQWLGPTDPERLGYQTQKPEGLLERIIESSCPPDGVVLDPFCGCGTTVSVAHRLQRSWIGVDITYLAIDLIEKRLIAQYGEDVRYTYEVRGKPRDLQGARRLFQHNPFDFERWAVSLVNAQPNLRQVGDEGADGVIRFPLDANARRRGRVLVSVKGGKQLTPSMVRDLIGTVEGQRAEMGLLITLEQPTRGMVDAAHKSGVYTWPLTAQSFPRVQVVTVEQMLRGDRPDLPPALLPYIKAQVTPLAAAEQRVLFE
jgi:DNA modification methylase